MTKTYTALITVNGYTDGRHDGVSSNEMTLTISQEEPIEYLYVENMETKVPVMFGESAVVKAKTNPAGFEDKLKWSIIEYSPDNKKYKIIAQINENSGLLSVDENSGSGEVTVRASYKGCRYKDVDIPIGCQTCDNGSCGAEGASTNKLSSVEFKVSLGNTNKGNNAGYLLLRSDKISHALYSPKALQLSSMVIDNEILYSDETTLRQILTEKTFADIVEINSYQFNINFYRLSDISGLVGGLYELNSGAIPFASYTIENPDQSPIINNRLRISETKDGATKVSEYYYDESTNEWSLSQGTGAKIITRTEQTAGDTFIRRETIKNSADQISSQIEYTYKEFAWAEELIKQEVDPEDQSLVTEFTYYENIGEQGKYSKLQSVEYPNGSWTYYDYDSSGRVSTCYKSLLDITIAQKTNGRVTTYNYNPTALGNQ